MKSFTKGMVFFISGLLFFIMLAGCTPSRAQTRGNDYAGSFDSENYDAFDRVNPADDEIPAYTDNKNTVKRDTAVRKEKKSDDKPVKVKSGAVKDDSDDFAFDERESVSDPDRAVSDDNRYESGANGDSGREESFYQKGYASWYGREFHGKTTASGERFDMNLLTAAHKTLPFGSIVEVTNLENGKSVKLKVNDRGPYRGNRIIDLSYNAAREIDMIKKGEVQVGIRVIRMGDNSVSADAGKRNQEYVEPVSDDDNTFEDEKPLKKDSGYDDYTGSADGMRLQAGAFFSRRNAESQKEKIEGLTDRPVKIIQDGEYYKIRIEGIKSRKELDRIKDTLNSESIQSFSVE